MIRNYLAKNHSVLFVKQEILTETSRYIDAVYVLARALDKYIETSCQLKTLSECLDGQELQSAIKKYQFHRTNRSHTIRH